MHEKYKFTNVLQKNNNIVHCLLGVRWDTENEWETWSLGKARNKFSNRKRHKNTPPYLSLCTSLCSRRKHSSRNVCFEKMNVICTRILDENTQFFKTTVINGRNLRTLNLILLFSKLQFPGFWNSAVFYLFLSRSFGFGRWSFCTTFFRLVSHSCAQLAMPPTLKSINCPLDGLNSEKHHAN